MKSVKFVVSIAIILAMCCTLFCACNSNGSNANSDSDSSNQGATSLNEITGNTITVDESSFDDYDNSTSYSEASANTASFSESSIAFSGSGASVSKTTLTITTGGDYIISGSCSNGQILISASKTDVVRLILNSLSLTCSDNPAIYATKAQKVVIILADGSANTLSDGSTYTLEADTDEPDATIFSKTDLTLTGTGSLSITANYKSAIKSKDVLKIMSGTIKVASAVDNGITGRDALIIKNGTINLTVSGDGIKATNDEDTTLGYVAILGGNITIVSAQDGIQAETSLLIDGGTINITSGGGYTARYNTVGKGLKATNVITIENGTININSADDAIHTNNGIGIVGGALTISTGDDGLHADSYLAIAGGEVAINNSYEGIEASIIEISGGKTTLVSSDDGVNAAGGASSSTTLAPNSIVSQASSNNSINISGGVLLVNATGDGIDANGSVTMTGGTVVVQGPTDNGNGSLDYDGTFVISGGTLIAAGSSGMIQSPSTSSSQKSITAIFTSSVSANTPFCVLDSSGNVVICFVPTKAYSAFTISSPSITQATYSVYKGGTASGADEYGLCSSYVKGTLYGSVTVSSSAVAQLGTSTGNWNGGGMGGGMGGGIR